MAEITRPPGQQADPAPQSETASQEPVRLSKEERRALLARIEREASRARAETHEKILQRAEQALQGGNREQAQRLTDQLEKTNPKLLGLATMRGKLEEARKREKQQANVKKAEEMLLRYIQERRKQAAELALETLSEIAPDHPRLAEYGIWVRDLDQEAAHLHRLDEELAAGRMAIQAGDLEAAHRRLETLREIDPDAAATARMAAELAQAERGQAASADIESIKERFEELLADGRVEEAEQELTRFASHELPKITVDQLRLRLDRARASQRDQQELEDVEKLFATHLAAGRWHEARDVAQRLGQRFPGQVRAAEMFHEVTRREAEARRQESIRQGTASLEQFIAEGRRQEAELALKLLQGKIDPEELARYEAQMRAR